MIKKIDSWEEYRAQYNKSVADPAGFWAEKAETFRWKKPWESVLDWDFDGPSVAWFTGGQLNITENCLDRHLDTQGDKTAILWEPNDPKEPAEHITYRDLSERVARCSNMLRSLGVSKGDRVCLYMPMVPELAVAVLACARIGAIHSVVFAGFSAKALSDRINDSDCKVLLTADEGLRGAKTVKLKEIADEALKTCPTITCCVVFKRTGGDITMVEGRDVWWHEVVDDQASTCEAETMESEDPLFILYTSGSTGKPKGVVHTTAGYMVYAEYSFRNVFQYSEDDIYWCTADIGWITGHSYIIYGPLLAGATTVMFEGVPTWPDAGRFWDVVARHKISLFYTAPTAIRALQAHADEFVTRADLSSLKVLGSVGEPINEEAWQWYNDLGRARQMPDR